jgi:hypothetical protein
MTLFKLCWLLKSRMRCDSNYVRRTEKNIEGSDRGLFQSASLPRQSFGGTEEDLNDSRRSTELEPSGPVIAELKSSERGVVIKNWLQTDHFGGTERFEHPQVLAWTKSGSLPMSRHTPLTRNLFTKTA